MFQNVRGSVRIRTLTYRGGRGEEMVGLAENALYHQDFDMCLSLSGGLYTTWVKNGGTRTANAHENRG